MLAIVCLVLAQDYADPFEAARRTAPRDAQLESVALRADGSPARPRVSTVGKQEAWSVGKFALGFMLKEAVVAAADGDGARLRAAGSRMIAPDFWADMGVFSIGARAAEKMSGKLLAGAAGNFAAGGGTIATVGTQGLLKAVGRTAIPLAAGLIAVQIVRTGSIDTGEVTRGTAKAILASAAVYPVDMLLRAYAYGPLMAAGPWGWVAIGALEVSKVALTLYLMDRLESKWSPFESASAPAPGREGVAPKIERLSAP